MYLDTIITYAAMGGPGGSIKVTGLAPFHLNSYAIDSDGSIQWFSEVIFFFGRF
jgi:hypothetical protein